MQTVKNKITTFYHALQQLPNYLPSQQVNAFFTEFCHYAQTSSDSMEDDFFLTPEVEALRQACAEAEYQLELFWTRQVLDAQHPRKVLQTFPYFENYSLLTKLENHVLLSQSQTALRNLLFVGAGPLPLTAILFAQVYGVSSVLVEKSQEAVDLASKLIVKLNLQDKITVVHADFLHFSSKECFDAVLMASLLFTAGNLDHLLKHLTTQIKTTRVLIRTAEGMRQLLYKKLPFDQLKKYLKPELVLHPHNEIVNSLILCSLLDDETKTSS